MQIKHSHTKISGFTLVEFLIYIAGLLAIGSVLIVLIVQFYTLYKEIIAVPRADRTGVMLVDRITKEIRSADEVDMLQSQFGTPAGVLDFDSVSNGVTTAKRFYVEDGIAKYKEGTATAISLSSKDFRVSNFNFALVNTPVSQAIRFTLELEYQTHNATETKAYTGFAILRESYE